MTEGVKPIGAPPSSTSLTLPPQAGEEKIRKYMSQKETQAEVIGITLPPSALRASLSNVVKAEKEKLEAVPRFSFAFLF
jgi:hypothetical protein